MQRILLVSMMLVAGCAPRMQTDNYRLGPLPDDIAIGNFDWESLSKAKFTVDCSCYFSEDCTQTRRGTMCSYVGDCMGGKGCRCRTPKPQTSIRGVRICGDAHWGQCDGVCIGSRIPLAVWEVLTRIDAARFADLLFQSYIGAARKGGPALIAPLRQAGHLEVTGDWQIEIQRAVQHVLMTLLGRDFLPPTDYARAAGEPRGQVLPTTAEGIELLDTVRKAFVAAVEGRASVEEVDRAIAVFWSSNPGYVPHHGGRCYPHGHPEYKEAAPCQVSEIRAALNLLLDGVERARKR